MELLMNQLSPSVAELLSSYSVDNNTRNCDPRAVTSC